MSAEAPTIIDPQIEQPVAQDARLNGDVQLGSIDPHNELATLNFAEPAHGADPQLRDPRTDPLHPRNLPRAAVTLAGPVTFSGPYRVERNLFPRTYNVVDSTGQEAFTGTWSRRKAEQMAYGETSIPTIPRRIGRLILRKNVSQ